MDIGEVEQEVEKAALRTASTSQLLGFLDSGPLDLSRTTVQQMTAILKRCHLLIGRGHQSRLGTERLCRKNKASLVQEAKEMDKEAAASFT